MVDRNDIDALLIGSLYGELSSADEARLRAHLESHPADRTALEGLMRTRDAVRASRIFDVQVEPPQSVSALLLQEAARRAPRASAREGWFARLRRSFLMSPAMAAAAMLILVIGVAGTIYMRQGDHFAAPQVAVPERLIAGTDNAAQTEGGAFGSAAAPAPAAPTTTPPAAAVAAAAEEADKAADSARAKLAKDARRDADGYRVGLADAGGRGGDALEQQQRAAEVAQLPKPEPRPAQDPKRDEKAKVARNAGPGALLEVSTPRQAPKDLDEERPQKTIAKGRAQLQVDDAKPTEAPMAEPAIAAAKPPAPAPRAPEPPPAAPAAASAPQGIARAPGAATGAGAAGGAYGGVEEKLGASDGELAWAKEQHTRLIGQVRAGHCTEAAGTAVALSSRAPGYYQQNVENDRSVKSCLPYINAERERAAERARARAATVRGSYEPASPAPKQAASKKAAPAKPAATDRSEPAKAAPATTKSN